MADNIAVTEGAGKTVATDDVGGVQYQRVKLDAGGDGVAVPLVAGSQAASASLPVTQSTEDVARMGIVTETAPASDTASSGLNGRLQRIAQRITSLIALFPTALGQGTMAQSLRVVIASNQSTLSVATEGGEYETVAASQTDQVLGATGAAGDYFDSILIVPATTSPGAVSIKDGSGGSSITIFTGGATSVSNLVPFAVSLGLRATSTGWRVTTGANVSAIGIGNFT